MTPEAQIFAVFAAIVIGVSIASAISGRRPPRD